MGDAYSDPRAQVMFSTGVIPSFPVTPLLRHTRAQLTVRSRRVFVEVPIMVSTTIRAVVGIALEQGNGTPYTAVYQRNGSVVAEIDVSVSFDTSMMPYDPVANR